MMPLEKLAAEILAWGILTGFSMLVFLFGGYWAIISVLCWGSMLYDRCGMFKFVWENTRESNESGNYSEGT